MTTMSGTLPGEPATTPVCSAFTFQRGCLPSSACANKPLKALSEVRAMPKTPQATAQATLAQSYDNEDHTARASASNVYIYTLISEKNSGCVPNKSETSATR